MNVKLIIILTYYLHSILHSKCAIEQCITTAELVE